MKDQMNIHNDKGFEDIEQLLNLNVISMPPPKPSNK